MYFRGQIHKALLQGCHNEVARHIFYDEVGPIFLLFPVNLAGSHVHTCSRRGKSLALSFSKLLTMHVLWYC